MGSLPTPLLNPLSPQEIPIKNKISNIKTLNFSKIPSWISLNNSSSSSSIAQNNQKQKGQVENLHLVSLTKQGKLNEAFEFLKQMDIQGITVNTQSYECLFETCGNMKSLSKGKKIHKRLVKFVKNPSGFVWNSVLKMYCECGCFLDARKLFDEMPKRNSFSWNIIISSYAQNGLFREAFVLLSVMDPVENKLVYASLIQEISRLELGKQVHSVVIKNRLTPDAYIDTALANMYATCECLDSSVAVFDGMSEKTVVTWTGLMAGYTQAEQHKEALALFVRMMEENIQLDEYAYSTVLKVCSFLNDYDAGRQIHGCIVKYGIDSDVSVGTPLLDFYVKCGKLDDACFAFKRIYHPNDVTWSSIISGYSQYGKFEECIESFKNLRCEADVLNPFIYTSIFKVCSALADLNLGMQVHADAIKRCSISELCGESALITMYSRSGRLADARNVFDSVDEPDTVAWTAIICGCSYHGHASEALFLFGKMRSSGVRPNSVTFIGVLTACSHSGLVFEARQYLDSMRSEFGIDATIDHYNCMIDIYSRAGNLEDALELVTTMPFEPNVASWKSLLGGCWSHGNVEIGKIASRNLLQLDPEDTAGYVLMFNLYASEGIWEEAAQIRKKMNEKNLKKDVSCSWLTIKGKVHRFTVGDRHHPQTEEIYSKLEKLNSSCLHHNRSTLADLNYDGSYPLSEQRKEQLLDHSERLAIAFSLISSPRNSPVLIFKNLRACPDCHDFSKQVSKITEREIVIRDSSRFHHFKDGQCSCNDYW